jgi:phosphatidylglycerol:prolipoprotein diacylglycerol transferase
VIPYITIPPLKLGGFLTLQPFGTLVVIGCLVGYTVACWHAVSVGSDRREIRTLILLVLIVSFIFAHWVSMLLYYPDQVLRRPWLLVSFNLSLSSYGGFLGAALGVALYWACYRRTTQLSPWKVGDAIAIGWTAGWFFGRLGCTVAHDHPGRRTDFFLAVRYPDGSRHDLGLYEWLFTICLLGLVFSIRRKQLPPGRLIGIVCVCYAPVRFLLDFLRVGEKQYFGWLPSQYFSVALLLFGLWTLVMTRKAQVR